MLTYDNTHWDDWLERREEPRSMLQLARNPFMLYMITQVYTEENELPANRGALFDLFTDFLLEDREKLPTQKAASIANDLAALGYAMQAEGEGTTFSKAQVMAHLSDDLALYYARSASILSGEDELRFTHQLLQEYFAARHLREQMKSGKSATELFPTRNWWEPQGWEETCILLAGLYSDDCTPVVDWLRDAQPEVAARCITESGAACPDETLIALRGPWLPRLTDLNRDPEPEARAAVGRGLGRLRLADGELVDNRPGVGVTFTPLPGGEGPGVRALPDIAWCEVPGITGWTMKAIGFGEDEHKEFGPYDIAPFRMAKYPVTMAQFAAFIEAGDAGWSNDRWWKGLDLREGHRDAPGEQRFKVANHPRETVSWWDAVAFCAWLSVAGGYSEYTLHEWVVEQGKDYKTYPGVRLPTEWEWQFAAQGESGREYPYKGDFDPAKGNTEETGIKMTSAVGLFPGGAVPDRGLLDMSGNVWEWCLNEYSTPANTGLGGGETRVVRGGSWCYDLDFARASYRSSRRPDFRFYYGGFRLVVVVPPSSSS